MTTRAKRGTQTQPAGTAIAHHRVTQPISTSCPIIRSLIQAIATALPASSRRGPIIGDDTLAETVVAPAPIVARASGSALATACVAIVGSPWACWWLAALVTVSTVIRRCAPWKPVKPGADQPHDG